MSLSPKSAAVAMPTREWILLGRASAASNISKPPILEPTRICKIKVHMQDKILKIKYIDFSLRFVFKSIQENNFEKLEKNSETSTATAQSSNMALSE